MKILLAACNAKYIHSNLAVYDLKAYAEKECQEHIVIREYTINQLKDDILKDLYREKPDVLCFSCYIWNIEFVRELAADIAKVLPKTQIWAGGPEVTYDPEEFLTRNPAFYGVMAGEGEDPFHQLSLYYLKGFPSLGEIHGICYREGGKIRSNGLADLVDMSEIPFIYEDMSLFQNRIIYYESSRGCPFSCSYCLSSIDKSVRFRDLSLVTKELQFFLDHKVPQVKFVDRTFNCRHEHAMTIWKYILDHDNGITNFHFEIAADLLREEELELISKMRPGLIQLEIGVQSTNPKTIEAIHRTMDFEELTGIVKRIHSFHNIHQHLDLIVGLPYEDYDRFHRSFNDVYGLKPQQLQLGFLKVLKGSRMHVMADEYDIVYKDKGPYEVLTTRWITYGDTLRLKTVESMVEVYYNSGQFQNTLEYLETFYPDAFAFFEMLGEFYEKKGYDTISHARIRRYDILLEFLRENPEIPIDGVIDAMLLDLYLRENLKSRPAFAPADKEMESGIWEYRRAKKVPKTVHIEVFRNGKVLLFDYSDREPLYHNAKVEDITESVMEYRKSKNL
ncbi:MAG: B12-binding domain-containing radical SAM protein [Eubacteriales bacterium]|nr:B12-binding domain-containing radical SAM protein [Eubacteriales bacterium]